MLQAEKAEKIVQRVQSHSGAARIILEIGKAKNYKTPDLFIPKKTRRVFLGDLNRLARQGLITVKKKTTKIEAALTTDGIMEFFKLSLNHSKKLPDGTICIVVFDVPEKTRKHRRFLRHFLWEKAFIPIQKSVWISQFDDAEILLSLFEMLKIKKWIKVYIAKEEGRVV